MRGREYRTAAVLGALLVVVAAVLAGCSLSANEGSTSGSVTGRTEMAPEFSGVTLDGAQVSLSEYRGKPVVLAFMASW
jgi:cytochrome oxidase Cu insertion factor (SCO1/SenC/PrrC family)